MIKDNPSYADGIPLTSDYRVQVNGAFAPVYVMPTRYDVPYRDGQPMSVYGDQPWRHPMYFVCADISGPFRCRWRWGSCPPAKSVP